MLKRFTLTFALGMVVLAGFAQSVPELLYYKFDGTGTSVPNFAIPGVGNNPATISGTGITQAPGGQFGNGLNGIGAPSPTDNLNTGWNLNLGGNDWTISFWIGGNPITSNNALNYFFGDVNANQFRCFTGGVANAGIYLRGAGLTDVILGPNEVSFPAVVTYSFSSTPTPAVTVYVNGVPVKTVATSVPNLVSTATLIIGGYSTLAGLMGTLDEFRFYNRALTATEVAATWNFPLPLNTGPIDIAVGGLTSPTTNVPCYGPAEQVNLNLSSFGSDTLDLSVNPVTVTALVTGAITTTLTTTLNTGILVTGASIPVSLGTLDMSAPGVYNIAVSANFNPPSLDGNLGNNTLSASFTNFSVAVLPGVPYVEDFETWTAGPPYAANYSNGWSPGGANNFHVAQATGANILTANTGPWFDNTLFPNAGGKYVFLETSNGVLGTESFLVSPCIDLSGVSGATLRFAYHMYGASMGGLATQIGANGVWTTIDSIGGAQHFAGADPWLTRTLSLAAYSGQAVQLRFKGVRGTSFEGDLAIDDVTIFQPAANDIVFAGLVNPTIPNCSFSGAEPITIRYTNAGSNAVNLSDLEASYTITGPINSGPVVQPLGPGVINPGDTITLTFTTPANLGTPGQYTVSASVNFTSASGITDGAPGNNQQTVQVQPGIVGNYTINSGQATGGTNFASFNDMISAFSTFGICGPVIVNVAPGSGPYTEQVIINAITGMSAANNVRINGNGNTLQFLSTNTNERGVLKLNGAEYFTFDSLRVEALGSVTGEFGWAVWLTGNARNLTFNRCEFVATRNSTLTNFNPFVVSSSATGATTAGAAADRLTITNCLFDGGYYGIVLNGPTAAPFATNVVFTDNVIKEFYLYGMFTRGLNNSLISRNKIFRDVRGTISTTYGIYITGNYTGTEISRNQVYDLAGKVATTTTTAYGIYGTGVSATAGQELLISNNLIYGFERMNGGNYGIYLLTTDRVKVYHNTVSVDNVQHPGAGIIRAFHHSGANFVADVRNNIFSVTSNSTGTKHVVYITTGTSIVTSDHNVLHLDVTAGTNSIGFFNAITYPTLTAWQAAGFDLNSVVADPVFIGNLPFPSSSVINNIAPPLAEVTDDFFGVLRGATPDPGAIEFAPQPADAGVVSINGLISGCGLQANTPISISIRNFGTDTLTSIPVSYRIGNNLPVSENANLTLLPGTTANFTFTTAADFSVPGVYVLSAWTSLPQDGNFFNDSTVGVVVEHYNSISTFPYLETFDSFPLTTATPLGTPVISLPGGWINSQQDGSQDWVVRSGTTPTGGTGPTNDKTQGNSSGRYLYVPDVNFNQDSVILISPCFDVSGISNPIFSFWYHSLNSAQPNNQNFLHIDALWNGTLVRDIIAPIGHKGPNWELVEIPMAAYPGTFAVRFRVNNNNLATTHDIAIDDVGLRELPGQDVGVAAILSPLTGCGLSASTQVVFTVENFGTDSINLPFQVFYEINGPNSFSGNVTVNDPLGPADQALVTLPGVFNFATPGAYQFVVWTQGLPNDGFSANDTLIQEVISIPVVTTYPYFEDFESGRGGWQSGSNNGINSWQFGTPGQNLINTAASGVNAWMTGLTSNYFDNEQSFVISPCLNFSSLALPAISISIWWNAWSGTDGAQLQASTDGGITWTTMGSTGLPDNWYNNASVPALAWAGGTNNAWSGRTASSNGSNGWVTARLRMPSLAGQSNVRLRVVFGSNNITNDEGFAFDNVLIYDIPSADVGLSAILSPSAFSCTDDSVKVEVRLFNEGTAAQSNIPVNVQVTGPVNATFTGVFPSALQPDSSANFVVGYFNAPTTGFYSVTLVAGLVGDTFASNDTLRRVVEILQTPGIPVTVSDSICASDSAQFTLYASGSGIANVWFDSPTGGNQVFVGDTLHTPFLTQSTTYWVESANSQRYRVGPVSNAIGSGGNFASPGAQGLFFTAFTEFVLDSVTVYVQNPGNVVLRLRNAGNTATIATVTVPVAVGGLAPVRIGVGMIIQPGSYRLDADGTTTGGLYRNTAGAIYPFEVPGIMSITGNTFQATGPNYYYFFYDWLISSIGCASARVPATALFLPPIGVDLGADAAVCPGFTLDATTVGAVSYQWNNDPLLTQPTLRVDSAGSYFVQVVSAFGCIDADTITVALLPGPLVNLGPDITSCNKAVLDAGNPGSQYAWSVIGQNNRTLTVTASGTYFVNVSSSGCQASDTVNVTILPGPVVNLGADREDCRDVTLDAGNPGATYMWSNGATTQSITLTPPFTASVVATSANGCADSAEVTINPGPDPVVDLGPDGVVCDSVVLGAGNPGASYLWNTGETTATLLVKSTGLYSVTVTDAIGCVGADSVSLTVNQSPVADFTSTFISGLTYSFQNLSVAGSYLWDFGDGSTSSAPNPTHTYPVQGTYEVTLVVTNECGSDTSVFLLEKVSIDAAFAALFQVAPNPSEGLFVLIAEGLSARMLEVEVLDLAGKSVLTQRAEVAGSLRMPVDLKRYAEGAYLLRVRDGDRQAVFRLVKQ